jgi:radical SAM superfamily enzyme YgiQ (UPF0313 family)
MSNLGLHAVYRLINGLDRAVCERAFLPDKDDTGEFIRTGTSLFSLESQRPLSTFDILAFSLSFEQDYWNIPRILELSGIPPFSSERDGRNPLVLAGGTAVALNPEPVADFFDLFFIGEAEGGEVAEEGAIEGILELYRNAGEKEGRPEFLCRLASIEGVYVPSLYEFVFEGPSVKSIRPLIDRGAPMKVKRVRAREGAPYPETLILTPDTEFRETHLIEIERGCGRGCRFCAAGFLYLPPRMGELGPVKQSVIKGMERAGKVGLVGAAVSEYPGLEELLSVGVEGEGEMTLSSLRLDALDPELLSLLKGCGYSTITLAPEAATERMRRVVNKGISDDELMEAIRFVAETGFKRVKLYFMVGLPTETDRDAGAIGDLAVRIKSIIDRAGRGGSLTLSINPFVPKPWTPFQWHTFEHSDVIEKRFSVIEDFVKGVSGIRTKKMSARMAAVEAYLSRGDRRAGEVIARAAKSGWRRALKSAEPGLEDSLYRKRREDEFFPWDVVDHGIDKRYLWREYQRGLSAETTPPCDVGLCTRCGVCHF